MRHVLRLFYSIHSKDDQQSALAFCLLAASLMGRIIHESRKVIVPAKGKLS